MNGKLEPKEKFIGFVDILGYSALTKAAEESDNFSFEKLEELLRILGTEENRKHFATYGPAICPMAPCIQKDLDFQIGQAWDSVVVSAEVSPAGVINLVSHCFVACARLLTEGVMCRGYIKRGRIFQEGMRVFGSGHVDAAAREKEVSFFRQDAEDRGTPFIEVDPDVVEYVGSQPDKCVKEMFSRMVLTYEGLSAVFPIRRMSHSFIISGFGLPPFDPLKEKKSNDNVRKRLFVLKERICKFVEGADQRAIRKSQHYIRALDEQLKQCDKTDEAISRLEQPFGRRMTRESFPGVYRD